MIRHRYLRLHPFQSSSEVVLAYDAVRECVWSGSRATAKKDTENLVRCDVNDLLCAEFVSSVGFRTAPGLHAHFRRTITFWLLQEKRARAEVISRRLVIDHVCRRRFGCSLWWCISNFRAGIKRWWIDVVLGDCTNYAEVTGAIVRCFRTRTQGMDCCCKSIWGDSEAFIMLENICLLLLKYKWTRFTAFCNLSPCTFAMVSSRERKERNW